MAERLLSIPVAEYSAGAHFMGALGFAIVVGVVLIFCMLFPIYLMMNHRHD
jgi:hypothetical protein